MRKTYLIRNKLNTLFKKTEDVKTEILALDGENTAALEAWKSLSQAQDLVIKSLVIFERAHHMKHTIEKVMEDSKIWAEI